MNGKVLLSVSETAEVMSLGRTTTWELVRSGRLPSVRLGKRVLVRRVDIERFAAELAMESVA